MHDNAYEAFKIATLNKNENTHMTGYLFMTEAPTGRSPPVNQPRHGIADSIQ